MTFLADSIFHLPVRLIKFKEPELKEPFRQSSWVYSCISVISRNIGSVPLVMARGSRRNRKIVEEHPLIKLFSNPNSSQSGEEFVQLMMIYLELDGEAFILPTDRNARPVLGKATDTENIDGWQLWLLPPSLMTEIIDKERQLLVGWEYATNSEEPIKFKAEDVIHIKYPNPYKPWRGLSPLEAALLAVRQDWKASQWNESFLDNGGDPGGWLTAEHGVAKPLRERMERSWNERYSLKGGGRGRTPFLEGGVKYNPNPRSQKDMEFSVLKGWNRDEILTVYGVPLGVLGFNQDINFSTLTAQTKRFWKETLMPKMRLVAKMLNKKLPPGDDLLWWWDTTGIASLQEDLQDKLETARMYRDLGYPIDDVNERLDLGMEEIPFGDVGIIQNQYVRLEDIATGATQGSGEASAAGVSKLYKKLSRWVFELRCDARYGKNLDPSDWGKRLRSLVLPILGPEHAIRLAREIAPVVIRDLENVSTDDHSQYFNKLKSRMSVVARTELNGRAK